MKNIKSFLNPIYFFVLVLFLFVSLRCATITPIVQDICNTSSDICNVAAGACQNVPPEYQNVCNIAGDICNYAATICNLVNEKQFSEYKKELILKQLFEIKETIKTASRQNYSLSQMNVWKSQRIKILTLYESIK